MFTIVVCLLFQIPLTAQTPCDVNGMAGIYPCNDYDLMSNIPISVLATTAGSPKGSDIWGWTDPLTGKEYAIVATTNSTAFVDISDPVNPIFLGRIRTANGRTSSWRDVKIYNNYAFIVADSVSSHGMQIFDLTELRTGPNPDLNYTSGVNDGNVQNFTGDNGISIGSCHNIVINESQGTAYLVGCGSARGGPIFVDISNPMSPTVSGSYSASGYTHDAQVITYSGPDTTYTGREILAASNGPLGAGIDKIVLLDVTNKNNPTFISEITYANAGYAHQGWFTDDHRYFLFGDETDEQTFGSNTKTFIFDMSDLDNPALSSIYTAQFDAIDHNGYVKGDQFFLANYRAGMRVLDITNIGAATNAMTEVGYFDTYPANNRTAFNGAWSIYPYFPSGNIIISDIERGLFVVRKSNTTGPAPTCSDGVQNGTETGIDCGGSCAPCQTNNVCSTTVTSFPYGESYEANLGLWSQSTADDINWTRDSGGTPSADTGPSSGSQGDFYVYVEASGDGTGFPNKRAILNSPCFDLSGETAISFDFKYHMFGATDMGTIALEVTENEGASWTSVWSQSGNKGNSWLTASVDLSGYANETIQLRFNRVTGSTWQADIAIDAVELTAGGNGPADICSGGISSFPYSEGFEGDLGTWTQSTADTIDWTVDANGTPSNNTGPSSASEGSNYIYVEASGEGTGFPNARAIVTSPCFNLSAISEATFNFKYHMFGSADMGSIDLEASVDNGATWTSIWNETGNKGNSWLTANIDLSTYVGGSVQLRFNRLTGGTWQADIAIDAINLTEGGTPTGGNECSGGITSYPYTEGYENNFGAWSQSTADDINWTVNANGTPSNNTGPSSAIEGSNYIYVEASGNGTGFPNKQAVITSPCYDLSSQTSANFSFSYHMFGAANMGTIALEASNNNGVTWTSIWSETGNKGNSWLTANVNLSGYLGDNIQLRFNRVTGNTWQADIAIDNINLITASTARGEDIIELQEGGFTFSVDIYPNPLKGNQLYVRSNRRVSYTVVNMLGQQVAKGKLDSNKINVNNLESGLYVVQFKSKDQIISKKFIKQ